MQISETLHSLSNLTIVKAIAAVKIVKLYSKLKSMRIPRTVQYCTVDGFVFQWKDLIWIEIVLRLNMDFGLKRNSI